MPDYRHWIRSDRRAARLARALHRAVVNLSLPVPGPLTPVLRGVFLLLRTLRALYHWLLRVVVCEPLFKACCLRHGRRVRTGAFVHWIHGPGDIVVGDDVIVDGRCAIRFARRFSERPRLEIGDRSGIGHNCTFTIGKRITIGRDCRIGQDVWIFDSSGHSSDPLARLTGLPPDDDDVRPVTIADNVWVARGAMIFPGVTLGEHSVVSAGAVVVADVPAFTLVAGNPARQVMKLAPSPPSFVASPRE
jgi:acetyltransferase-like isoleucine patch superfamily enzyme